MFSEAGDVSHKRWISVTVSATICFTAVWVDLKYPALITGVFNTSCLFVAVMSGVATVAQIVSLIKGTPPDTTSTETTEVSATVTKTTQP